MWIQTGVTVRKRLSWVLTSVTLTFGLWPWPFAWASRWSLVISPESFMMIRWWEYIVKTVTDRRTENTIHRAALSQLKHMKKMVDILQTKILKAFCWNILFYILIHIRYQKKHRVGFFVQPEPLKKSPRQKPWVRRTWWFFRGFWLNRVPNKCGSYFCPCFLAIQFYGEHILLPYSFLHSDFYQKLTLLECTFKLFHLQAITVYPSNHNGKVVWPVIQWHHNGVMWPNIFGIFQDGARLEEIKLNNSTICGLDMIMIY